MCARTCALRSHHCHVDLQKDDEEGSIHAGRLSAELRDEDEQVRQEVNVNKVESLALTGNQFRKYFFFMGLVSVGRLPQESRLLAAMKPEVWTKNSHFFCSQFLGDKKWEDVCRIRHGTATGELHLKGWYDSRSACDPSTSEPVSTSQCDFFPLCGFTLFKQGHRNRLESTLCFTGVIMVNKGGTYDEWLP